MVPGFGALETVERLELQVGLKRPGSAQVASLELDTCRPVPVVVG